MNLPASYGVIHHLDLFSGIGGFGLAVRLAGLAPSRSYHSEIDPYAEAVYRRRFPQSEPLGDIRRVCGHDLLLGASPDARWLVTGGFPCQDLSPAGKGRGIDGPQSGLWREMLRVVGELQPHAAVFENVPALRKRGLATVLRGLAAVGFDAEWGLVSARDLGAPHLRQRLWIVAHPRGRRRADGESLSEAGRRKDVGEVHRPNDPADRAGGWADWPGVKADRGVHGRPWVCRVADGVSARVDKARLTGLGNAVVPAVAALAVRRAVPHLINL